MKILFVGSEALPFVSSGGLGDVLGALPPALKKMNPEDDIRVVLPLYAQIKPEYRAEMKQLCTFTVDLAWRKQYCAVMAYKYKNVTYYFIDNEYYFKRQSLYGSFDDAERYAYFCRAVLEMMPLLGFYPDVLHANDWQSALCVIYLERIYKQNEAYRNIRTVYTVHNIDYQGIYDFSILEDVFGLSGYDRQYLEFDGCINLAKGAIVLCDKLTTVSPRYAEELKEPYYGKDLCYIISSRADSLQGIVNGIDTDYYNPATDKQLTENYSVKNLSGKAADKTALQRMFGLPEVADIPLIAMVSRLASHKGFDLVKYVMDELLEREVQFVLLGTGEQSLEDFFADVARRYPYKTGISLTFNKDLSKQIYAGSDIFLMPSMSEPCGLSQMIASRYGTVPVVRETGGLADTIKPYTETEDKAGKVTVKGNGFTFATYNAHDMLGAIDRATAVYGQPEKWNKLISRVMKTDFSWDASAAEYLAMYKETVK